MEVGFKIAYFTIMSMGALRDDVYVNENKFERGIFRFCMPSVAHTNRAGGRYLHLGR